MSTLTSVDCSECGSSIKIQDTNLGEDKNYYCEECRTLPVYSKDSHKRFVADMQAINFRVRDYYGRNFYHGPAVTCSQDSLQTVIRATTVKVQWDSLGRDLIVYPK